MRLSIDISDETHRELKAKAAREGVTISDIVRIAVEKYVRGNFHLGVPTVAGQLYKAEDRTIHVPAPTTPRPKPDVPPPFIRPISKAEQAKGKSRG